jgi:tetratricopeptide (TPR) repeat protein
MCMKQFLNNNIIMKVKLLSFFMIFLFFGCSKKTKNVSVKKKKINIECIKLNDKVVYKLNEYYFKMDSVFLKESELSLKKAIACNEDYLIAYNNLLTLYFVTKENDKALSIVNKLSRIEPDNIKWITYKGRIFRDMNLSDSSFYYNKKSLEIYDQLIYNYPDSLDLKLNRLVVKFYLKGDRYAINKEINYLKESYPADKYIIEHFFDFIGD